MEIRVEKVIEAVPDMDMAVSLQNYNYSQPTAGTDGASFPAIPRLRRFAVTSVIALGTASLGSQPPDLSAFEHRTIVVPAVPEEQVAPLAEQYSRLREEIEASGVPMLSDEELRNEIRERRGVRPETEG